MSVPSKQSYNIQVRLKIKLSLLIALFIHLENCLLNGLKKFSVVYS